MSRFSVIIPLYNKAHTVKKTINSVLSQTFQDFEIIVINDGSTDNGVEIISENFNDKRIQIIDQKNLGVSEARNNGIRNSRYEYVALLDADDAWETKFLEKVNDAIVKFPEAAFYGTSSMHVDFITNKSSDSTIYRYKNKIQIVDYFENPHTMPHTSAMVLNKGIFNMIDLNGEGFPVGMRVCEDWSCFYNMAFRGKFVYIGFPLGIRYNNIPGQITSLPKEARFELYPDVINFYNKSMSDWIKIPINDAKYLVFLKYDLRTRILNMLREKDYKTLEFLLQNLSPEIKFLFRKFELNIYRNKEFRQLSILNIYITKVIWRQYGYPIVGKNNLRIWKRHVTK